MLKIASWNVNSIRVRLKHFEQWLQDQQIDFVALQETKCMDDKFPKEALSALDYRAQFIGQKSYNGVSVVSRDEAHVVFTEVDIHQHEQKRFLASVYQDILIVNVYVPNGQSVGSEKFEYKLAWLAMLLNFITEAKKNYKKIIILGDFNIAPGLLDYTSANYIGDDIMKSPVEQAIFQQIIDLGFVDSFRMFNKQEKQYSWWDYRIKAFDKNLGYRIDHILVSESLVPFCVNCEIDKTPRALEQPSDHAPIILTLNLKRII